VTSTWRDGVADAVRFTIADLTMVRREVLIGFGVAGVLATVVPSWLWNDLFLHGHGIWTSLENALVGPLIAMVSFTCSIGNVALAAALWKGGIAFSGVISFLFGDLLAIPLIAIYRRYYGTRVSLRMVLLFWATMSTAGFVTGQLFDLADWSTASRHLVGTTWAGWGVTTWLNLLVVAAFVWLFLATKKRRAASALVTDPICGMQVRPDDMTPRTGHDGAVVSFCSDECRNRFEADRAELVRSTRPSRSGELHVGPGLLAQAEGDGAPSARCSGNDRKTPATEGFGRADPGHGERVRIVADCNAHEVIGHLDADRVLAAGMLDGIRRQLVGNQLALEDPV
jgi:hypothetical protein